MRLRIAEFLRRWVRHEDLAKLQSRAVFGFFFGKRPHFLDKPVVQLPGPLAREEINDFVSSVNEFRSVPPA